jgi:hypothetical protein
LEFLCNINVAKKHPQSAPTILNFFLETPLVYVVDRSEEDVEQFFRDVDFVVVDDAVDWPIEWIAGYIFHGDILDFSV